MPVKRETLKSIVFFFLLFQHPALKDFTTCTFENSVRTVQ